MSGAGYFLYHSIGMFPDKARLVSEALTRLGIVWGTPDDSQWDASLAIRAQFIERWRELLGAPAGTMTTAENVTTALHSVVGSLPERHLRGRKLLIAADCFPGVHFLLSGMATRHGYVLDTVQPRPGETWVRSEDFIARWDAQVGVALITFVTSHASYRCDLTVNAYDMGHRRIPVSSLPVLAGTLAVSLEELIGTAQPAKKRGPAPKLQQQIERIQRLPKAQQRFVMQMLDTVLAQADR